MFTKTARSATNPTTTTPSEAHPVWTWDLIAQAVPELPCGAVTLIVLSGDDPQRSHFVTVGDLVGAMINHHRPITYISVDGDGGREGLAETLTRQSHDLVTAMIDRDYKVMARTGDGNGFVYPCGIPTLDNVERFLAGSEREAGQRLLILDGFERARPYRAVGPATIPASAPLTAEDADAWRSADLRAFAESRPHAPTVVVWNSDATQRPTAKRSLGDAAEVVVLHMATSGRDWLSVSTRADEGCRPTVLL